MVFRWKAKYGDELWKRNEHWGHFEVLCNKLKMICDSKMHGAVAVKWIRTIQRQFVTIRWSMGWLWGVLWHSQDVSWRKDERSLRCEVLFKEVQNDGDNEISVGWYSEGRIALVGLWPWNDRLGDAEARYKEAETIHESEWNGWMGMSCSAWSQRGFATLRWKEGSLWCQL